MSAVGNFGFHATMNLFTCLMICVVLQRMDAQRIEHPACPDGLKYIYVNPRLGWVGLGWAWTSENTKLHNITMDVDFATAPLHDPTFIGSLKFIRFEKIENIEQVKKWNIIYEVIFPTQDPLPDVTKVILNGDTLCDAPEKLNTAERPDVVQLRLQYNNLLKEQFFTSKLIKKLEPTPVPAAPVTQENMQNEIQSNETLGCGKVDLSNIYIPLILEGTTIQRGTWPWLVTIYSYFKLRLGFRCGATLVSRKLVVTAAHCFFDVFNRRIKTEDVILILGQYNLKRPYDKSTKIVYPESINIHPNYQKRNTADSDIAVVVLTNAVRFTSYIRPACLWKEKDTEQSIVGQLGYTAGWGRDENGYFFTELPKQVEIPVVSNEICLQSHESFSSITTEETFCAGWHNGAEGPCNGDSGGPLIFKKDGSWTLRGVVSTSISTDGGNTCNLNEYVVFTDVAKFREWILTFSDDSYKF